MPILFSKSGLVVLFVALCFGGRTAHAQAMALNYWTSGAFMGLADNPVQSVDSYGNFPAFDARSGSNGFTSTRTNFSNGFFVGSQSGALGLNGLGLQSSPGALGSFSYQGAQFGYNFQKSNDLPLSIYTGFDTVKYNGGIGSNPLAPFDNTPGNASLYTARAGVEFRPTSNLSLGIGVGYTQQGRADNDTNSPSLVGSVAPFARR